METTRRFEAQMLSRRIGLRAPACEAWMRHTGVKSIMDLMSRYPGAEHADAMAKARDEIEEFVLDTIEVRI